MHRTIMIALLINACCLPLVRAEKFASKVPLMPDLCQTDAAFASLPNGGKYWCGPTAVANALIAMDRCCYDNLVPGDVNSKRVQLDLLATLGQPNYNPDCDLFDPSAGVINAVDLSVFADYWLFGTE